MSSTEKRLAARLAVERAIRKLIAGAAVTDAEIVAIISGIFTGRWIGIDLYKAIQRNLEHTHAQSAAAREAVRSFLHKGYHRYLACSAARRSAMAPNIIYKVDHIPKTTANNRRPAQKLTARYLTIHSTGNPSSAANGERAWLTNPENHRTASFHLVVDAKQAVECIPFDEVAWHAGDGNGDGNKKSISLEICESGDREVTLKNAIALTAKILRENGIGVDNLRRHHDWATKMCPRILIVPESRHKPGQTWEWFKSEVEQLV